MASNTSSAAARLCALACRQAVPRATTPRIMAATRTLAAARRQFTTSQSRWEDKAPTKDAPAAAPAAPAAAPKEPAAPAQAAAAPATPEDGMTLSDAQAEFKNVEILDITAKEHGYGSFDEYMERHAVEAGPATPRAERDFDRWITQLEEVKVDKNSWWHDPDDPEMDCEEVEDFDEDDMTEMAHAKLEEIKEMRQYARRAVYELPLLSSKFPSYRPSLGPPLSLSPSLPEMDTAVLFGGEATNDC